MARPAIAVALPLSESTTVSAELLAAGFEVIEIEAPRELEKALDVRRDIALAILDGEVDAAEAAGLPHRPDRCRPADPGSDRRLAARLRAPGAAGHGRLTQRVLHAALLGRLDPLAGRSDVHPARDRRRRQRPDPPGRRPRQLAWQRHDDRGLQSEGRRRQDDHRDQPRGGDPGPQGQVGPAHRCRYRDRSRDHVARDRGRPDGRRQLARRGRRRPDRRRSTTSRRGTRAG